MNDEILDHSTSPKSFLKEPKLYRYLLAVLWTLLTIKLFYTGLYKLHQYSESLRGKGLLVFVDTTPNLIEVFQPITFGIISIGIIVSVLKNAKNRPKLLLLYLSLHIIFLMQGSGLTEGWIVFLPFLGLLKFKFSFNEGIFTLALVFIFKLLFWNSYDITPNQIAWIMIDQNKCLSYLLILLSLGKYSTNYAKLIRMQITRKERLFILLGALPWILVFLFDFLGLDKGSKFF